LSSRPQVQAGARLVIATRNEGKWREVAALLQGLPLEVVSLQDYPACPEADEPWDTFAGNAAHKALQAAGYTGCLALADDSGLVVDALDGRPGVQSARYGTDDADRITRLLGELAEVLEEQRTARFVCAIALADPGGQVACWEGSCEGVIAHAPRGEQGFGYDPVFVYEGYTFAEMSRTEKAAVSHRGQALRRLLGDLAVWLSPPPSGLTHDSCGQR
jgi:XTP/dITP diphosphohydrolase